VSKERRILTVELQGTLRFSQEARKEKLIFISARPPAAPDSFETGAVPGSGTFFCIDCGSHLSLLENDALPECPDCGGGIFQLDSIFESMQDHGSATSEFSAPAERTTPAWIHEARAMLPGPGRYLAYLEDEDTIQIFPIERGWTRIGRSAVADIRLDDPSVSRRHALVVSEKPSSLRVLDDRSLNGVQLNGEQVEWARLGDGDELAIGRYRLFALET
jgi:FHA domain/Zinc-ribbon containing domain